MKIKSVFIVPPAYIYIYNEREIEPYEDITILCIDHKYNEIKYIWTNKLKTCLKDYNFIISILLIILHYIKIHSYMYYLFI